MAREFDFSKFVKDIEKKEKQSQEKRRQHEESFRDHPMRKLNILTRELWQNRITWRKK